MCIRDRTFIIPAGRFSTHKIEYTDNNGVVKSRTVLMLSLIHI